MFEKIDSLPGDRRAEIEDFVDLIIARDQLRSLTRAAAATGKAAFDKVWNNREDEVYDGI